MSKDGKKKMLMEEDGSENESQFDVDIIFIKIDLLEESLLLHPPYFLFDVQFMNDYSILIFVESFMVRLLVGKCSCNVIEFLDRFCVKCNNVG